MRHINTKCYNKVSVAKRRSIKYSKPNIVSDVKKVSKNIKKNIDSSKPPIKRPKSVVSKNNHKNTPINFKNANVNILNDLPSPNKKKLFIIGGGPSADIDFSILKDHDVMAVNKAIEHIDNPKYFVTMDYTFFRKSNLTVDQIKAKADNSYFILNTSRNYIKNVGGVFTDTRNNLKYAHLNKMTGVIPSNTEIDTATGFSTNLRGFAHGSNSGYCALQLALLLGYEEIYLLGYDLKVDNKSKITHFHKGYRQNFDKFRSNLAKYQRVFAKSFEKTNKQNIYSCSQNSYLNSFIKYISIWKALRGDNILEIKKAPSKPNSMSGDLSDLMIVGYYTLNTPYEKEAQKLIKSLNKLNLRHDIVGVPNLGSWQANTRFKAQFMLDELDKHPDCRLLYVDCDAIVHKRPELFVNYKADVAVRWQDFRWRENECLSGTIYMENNARTRKLCKIWLETNDKQGSNTKTFEQWNLGDAIKKMQEEDGLIAKNLPPEYTFIFDSMRRMYPNAVAVIEHFQASRKLRNKV